MSIQGSILGGFFIKEEPAVSAVRWSSDFVDGYDGELMQTVCASLLQGKLSQAPISTFQVATAAGGNAAGSNYAVQVHRLPQHAEMPQQQLYAMQTVSLVPATQSKSESLDVAASLLRSLCWQIRSTCTTAGCCGPRSRC